MTKMFTVAEAEALLPMLDRAFGELETLRRDLDREMDRLKILDVMWGAEVQDPSNPDREEFLAARTRVRRLMEGIEALIEERILSRGIRFPPGGLEHGLVDFPTRFQGRTVYLCWKRGEDEILSWHETDAGFAGRRPLTRDQALDMGPDETVSDDDDPEEASPDA